MKKLEFKDWFINEVSKSVINQLEKWSRENWNKLPFNNLFPSEGDDAVLRRVIKLDNKNKDTVIPQSILDKLEELNMRIDYERGLVTDSNGRSYRLGKYLLGKNSPFSEEQRQWWVKSGEPLTSLRFLDEHNRYVIVLSRSPVDVVRMSDHDGWTSCHAEDESYFQCAVADAKGAGGIAYVVEREDLRGVNLQEPEIFVDPDRGVGGIKPLGRVRLRQLVHKEDGYDLAVPEERTYGTIAPGFLETVRKWALEQQQDVLGGSRPRVGEFILKGGSYQDTKASRLLNHLFGDDLDRGDVEHEEGGDVFSQYEQEVDEIKEEYRNHFKHSSFHAEVEDSEGHPYVWYMGWIRFEFPDNLEIKEPTDYSQRKEVMKWARNELWSTVEDFKIEGNSVIFDLRDSDSDMTPDGFRSFLDGSLSDDDKRVEELTVSLYHHLVKLRLIGRTKAYDIHSDISRMGDESHFQHFELNDQDEQHIELSLRDGILVDEMTQEEISRNLPYSYAERLQTRLMVEINKWADQYHAALMRQGRFDYASEVKRPFRKEFNLVPEVKLTNAGGMVKNIYFQMDLNINIMSVDSDVDELFEFLHFLDKNYERFVELVKYVYDSLKVR